MAVTEGFSTGVMMAHLYRAAFFVVFLSLMAYPSGSRALDLGLTPSHVFSLWTNINKSLIASSRLVSNGIELSVMLKAMKPKVFNNKKPADVLDQLAAYRTKLDRLLRAQNLPETKQTTPSDGAITPSDVYVNSGHVLNAQVTWLIVGTGPEQTVSQFYTRHGFSGKSPSDVYALVEMANRRMDQLLQAAGA